MTINGAPFKLAKGFFDAEVVRQAVHGNEPQVIAALGIDLSRSGHTGCPFPDHDDRNPSWRWDNSKRRYFCTCGSGDIFDVVRNILDCGYMDALRFTALALGSGGSPVTTPQYGQINSRSSKKPKKRRWSVEAETQWASCRPIFGVAEDYLLARNCAIPPADGDLRWHPNLPHPNGINIGPAIVARVGNLTPGPHHCCTVTLGAQEFLYPSPKKEFFNSLSHKRSLAPHQNFHFGASLCPSWQVIAF